MDISNLRKYARISFVVVLAFLLAWMLRARSAVSEPASSYVYAEESQACIQTDHPIVIVVDPFVVGGIRRGLDQFESDLCDEGYGVIEKLSDFATPPQVRAYLTELHSRVQLIGAIFIGYVPHA